MIKGLFRIVAPAPEERPDWSPTPIEKREQSPNYPMPRTAPLSKPHYHSPGSDTSNCGYCQEMRHKHSRER